MIINTNLDTINNIRHKRDTISNIYTLRCNRIVPILKDDKLYIYKINIDNSFNELQKYYDSYLSDSYESLLENYQISEYYKPKDLINYRNAEADDIIKYLNLNNEENINNFLKKYSQEKRVNINLKDDIYIKEYKKANFEEVLEKEAKLYKVCTHKINSKIVELMSFIKGYSHLDIIVSIISEFLDIKDVNYPVYEKKNIEPDKYYIEEMDFNSKEKNLLREEKIKILKDIYNSLNIECAYCKHIIDFFEFWCNRDIIASSYIIDFAKHNYEVLENSEFSKIFHEIKSKGKVLQK